MSQKLKKSEQIILLKAQVIKLKRKFKEAKSELADRDNDIHDLTTKIVEQELFIAKLRGTVKSESKNPRKYPNESIIEFREVDGSGSILSADTLKKGDVLVFNLSGQKYFSKESEYKVIELLNRGLGVRTDFKDFLSINHLNLACFTLKPKPIKPKKAVK